MLTLIPTLTLLLLGLTTWRGHSLLGHLPIPSLDDPKFIEESLFQGLYRLTLCLYLAKLLLRHVWFPFTVTMLWVSYRYSRRLLQTVFYGFIHIAVYALPWLIIAQDPAQRITWLLD
ncbi:MAG: hypothetical protein F6J95_021755 [Leptolyngbya sp. SIO1E4]|nr:hypothetical protein [Leptolyngbya sp. SIO1E4]